MTKNLQELIDRANGIIVYFQIGSYKMHHYENGSFVDFKVKKVVDLPTLQRLAGGLEIKFFVDNGFMIVRLFERDSI